MAVDPDKIDYVTKRYEPAGFPLIGGSSDIGFEFGAVGTLTRFGDGTQPYIWNMDVVLAASLKAGPTGVDVAQQNYLWQWDVPGLDGGRLRLNPAVSYTRTVNYEYYGLGNATSGMRPANLTGDTAGRYFEFIQNEATLRHLTRIKLHGPFDLMLVGVYRFDSPEAYDDSLLSQEIAHGLASGQTLYGQSSVSLVQVGGGIVYDTRDNEFFPRHGSFDQLGTNYIQGFPTDSGIRYGESAGSFAGYFPILKDLTFASRFVFDLQYGHVPFYDLFTGGPFIRQVMPGGQDGVRGVPIGRYSGLVKFVLNEEFRTLPIRFRVLEQDFHLGGSVFFDTGRVWTDYTFKSPLDGSGLGMKWGTGVGAFLEWGQAAVFRAEIAYSPDAESENPGFPFGIYVEDGVMF